MRVPEAHIYEQCLIQMLLSRSDGGRRSSMSQPPPLSETSRGLDQTEPNATVAPTSSAGVLVSSGGNAKAVLTFDKLDVNEVYEWVGSDQAGAIASFLGTTRDNFNGMFPLIPCGYVLGCNPVGYGTCVLEAGSWADVVVAVERQDRFHLRGAPGRGGLFSWTGH